MSEWKRHRGSKSMPKCLEGKKFEVRHRDGKTAPYDGTGEWYWDHRGNDWDIFAYRILQSEPAAEPAKPDYSKGFPEGTTAKDIGAKVGDEFVVVCGDSRFKNGDVVKLAKDDGSDLPWFSFDGNFSELTKHCMYWHELAPITQKTAIELQSEEVGIPEPVQYVSDGDKSPEHVEKQDEIVHMPTTAPEFLQSALSTLTQRGQDYDKPEGERSAAAVAVAFNAITGRNLTEAEVWLVLQLVKDVRQWQNPERYHADSALDCVAYAALKAEALAGGK